MARSGDLLRNPATGDEYSIVHAAAETDGALLEMEVTFPPGAPMPPLHVHPLQQERFVVLGGILGVNIGGRRSRFETGATYMVPPGVRRPCGTRPALRALFVVFSLVARVMGRRLATP